MLKCGKEIELIGTTLLQTTADREGGEEGGLMREREGMREKERKREGEAGRGRISCEERP